MNGPRIANRRHEIVVGAACLILGTWLIYDAYDARGVKRPYALHLLPGL